MSGNSSRPLATHSGWLKLRVDSKEFVTTMTTLCKVEGSRVSEMVQTGRGCIQDAFGVVHVDYNADLFDIILHYLRTGRLILRNNTVEDVLAEADFWRLPGLAELCQAKLHDSNATSCVKDMSVGAANIESRIKEAKENAHAHGAVVTEQRIDSVDPNASVMKPVEYTPPLTHSQPLQQEEPQVADLMKTLAGQRIPPQKESSDTTSEQQPATASEDVNNNRVPRMPVQATRFRQGQALLRPTALQHNIGPVAQTPLTFAGLAASSRDIPMGADRQKADAECKGEAKKGPDDSQNDTKSAGDSSNFPAPPNLQPQRTANVTEKLEPPQPRTITATASPLMRQLFRRGGAAGQFKAQVAQQGPARGNTGGAQQS
ncbi:CRE-Potassium channel tetramerization-type BTB domain containing protein [Aphelenchoides avenae]|nr:CRE-Potassium channel tetramerization-type BTB domain containing protein [Aphelenchus avenae]